MSDLQGNISLNAAGYTQALESMARSLTNYTNSAEIADKATRAFAKSDSQLGKLVQEMTNARTQVNNLVSSINKLRSGGDVFERLGVGLKEGENKAESLNKQLNALGLTYHEILALQDRYAGSWDKLSSGERILARQQHSVRELGVEIESLARRSGATFEKMATQYNAYLDRKKNLSSRDDDFTDIQNRLLDIDKELGKTLKSYDSASPQDQLKISKSIVKLQAEQAALLKKGEAIANSVIQNVEKASIHFTNEIAKDASALVKARFSSVFDTADETVKMRLAKLQRRVVSGLQGAGFEGVDNVLRKFETGDYATRAEYQEKYSGAHSALKEIDEVVARQQRLARESQVAALARPLARKFAGTFERPEDQLKSEHAQLMFIQAMQREAGNVDPSEILGRLTGGSPEERASAEQQYGHVASAVKDLLNQKQREENRLLEVKRQKLIEIARQTVAAPITASSREGQLAINRSTSRFADALAGSLGITGNETEEQVKAMALQRQQDLQSGSAQIARQHVQLADSYLTLQQATTKELQKQLELRQAKKAAQITGDLRENVTMSDPWLSEALMVKVTAPAGTDPANYHMANAHLKLTQANAFAEQMRAEESMKATIAGEYATKGQYKLSPEELIGEMRSDSPNWALRKEILEERPKSYAAVLAYAQQIARLEQRIAQDQREGTRNAERGASIRVAQLQQEQQVQKLKGLRGSDNLDWMQGEFENKYNRKISGFGQIDVALAGEKVLGAYSRQDALPLEDFKKNIGAILAGNKQMINQYPDLSREVARFSNAIKNGEIASAKLVHHWDNFYRLILARGITFAFYNITQLIQQGVRDSFDLYKAIAEIQTISQAAPMDESAWTSAIRNISDTYHMAQGDIAEALYEITSNQVAVGQSAIAMTAVLAPFAKTTKATLTDSVNIMSSVLNAFNINAGNSEIVAAQLFKTVELGRVRVSDMANTFGRVSTMAQEMNVSLEETNALIAHITISGVKFERASTYIVNMMSSLAKPSEQMQEFLHSIGASSGQSAIQMYSFVGVLEEMMKYTRGQSGELATLATNLRAFLGYSSSLRDLPAFKKVEAQMKTAAGSYAEAEKIMFQSTGERLQEVVTKFKNEFLNIGMLFNKQLVLGLDNLIGKISTSIPGNTREVGISDLGGLMPALGAAGGGLAIAKGLPAVHDAAALKTAGKFGRNAGFALAGYLTYNWVIDLIAKGKLAEIQVFKITDAQERSIEMERRYHAEMDKLRAEQTKITGVYEQQTKELEEQLDARRDIWDKYYKSITKSQKEMVDGLKDVGNYMDTMLKRDQNLFVGGAFDDGESSMRRMMVLQGLSTRTGEDPDIAKRFLSYGQDTLSFLDTKIQEIEKGESDDEQFYMLFAQQREEVISAMNSVVGDLARKAGVELGPDMLSNLMAVKSNEEYWDDYLKEFGELKTLVDKKLQEGITTQQALIDIVAYRGNLRQQSMFSDWLARPEFSQVLGLSQDKNELGLAHQKRSSEIEAQMKNVGSDTVLTQLKQFEALYRGASILSDLPGMADRLAIGDRIRATNDKYSGTIPEEEQAAFKADMVAFIESFKDATASLKAATSGMAFTPGGLARQRAAELIYSSMQQEKGFAAGGSVDGPRGSDTVPAWLTPGEFVVRKEVAQRNAGLLDKLNAGYYNYGGMVMPTMQQMYMMQRFQQQEAMMMNRPNIMWSNAGRSDQYGERMAPVYGRMWSGAGRTSDEAWTGRGRGSIQMGGWAAEEMETPGLRDYNAERKDAFAAKLLNYKIQTDANNYEASKLQKNISWLRTLKARRNGEDQDMQNAVLPSWLTKALALGTKGVERYVDPTGSGYSPKIGSIIGDTLTAGTLVTGIGGIMGGSLKALTWGKALLGLGGAAVGAYQGGDSYPGMVIGGLGGGLTGLGIHQGFSAAGRGYGKAASLLKKKEAADLATQIVDPNLTKLMTGFAAGGWVNSPRSQMTFKGNMSGGMVNNYSTTANITLQSSGNEGYDARRLMDQINRESYRGTRRLQNVS